MIWETEATVLNIPGLSRTLDSASRHLPVLHAHHFH